MSGSGGQEPDAYGIRPLRPISRSPAPPAHGSGSQLPSSNAKPATRSCHAGRRFNATARTVEPRASEARVAKPSHAGGEMLPERGGRRWWDWSGREESDRGYTRVLARTTHYGCRSRRVTPTSPWGSITHIRDRPDTGMPRSGALTPTSWEERPQAVFQTRGTSATPVIATTTLPWA